MSVVLHPEHFKAQKRAKERERKKEPKPTPYALAATFTAEDSGAIEPGDNPPVAFFTQLSDVFLDDDDMFWFLFVSFFFVLTAKVMTWH